MEKTIKDLIAGFRLYPVWLHQAWYALSSKYKRTVFGTFWIAGQYAITSLAFAYVFGTLFQREMTTFLPYAMAGRLVADAVLTPLQDGPELYIANSGIIRNYAHPFTYFSFELTARNLMMFFHNLAVYYIFMVFNHSLVFPDWSLLPGIVLMAIIMLSWSTVLGMLASRYRDLRFMLPNLTTPLFFLTPIYWPVEELGPRAFLANWNPLFSLVDIVRQPLLGHQATALNWGVACVVAAVGVIAWFIAFALFRRRIPFWI